MTMMAPTPLRTSSLGMRSSTVNSTATTTSNFSDNALSTLESLVLECALEDARLKAEEGMDATTTTSSTTNPYEMKARDYAALQQLDGNDACADCGSSDTEWASVTFGILICTSCSGHHRALGTHISRVRSVKMDQWSDQHLMRMKCGGNGTWQQHCGGDDSMDSTTSSFQEKYDSDTAREYLTLLKTRIAEKTLQQAEKEEENDNDDPLFVQDRDDDRMSKSMSVVTGGTRSRLARSSASRTRSNSGRSSARQSRSVSPMPGFGRSNSGPVAASSPTITYMGRSFPASSVNGSSSNLNQSLSNLAHNTPVLTPLLQALEQAKTKLTHDLLQNNSSHHHNSLDSSAHRRQQYYQNNHPVASLFFSRQDILEITNDAQEFARLKRSLKHNGAVTNQVVTQRMFAFVANRRKRQEMMQQKQQQRSSSASSGSKQPVA